MSEQDYKDTDRIIKEIYNITIIKRVAYISLILIVLVDIVLGCYLRTGPIVDAHYVSTVYTEGELVYVEDENDMFGGYLEYATLPETKVNDYWKKDPLDAIATWTILLAIDVALIVAGVFAYHLIISYEERDTLKFMRITALLGAFVVVSAVGIIFLFNYFIHRPPKTYTSEKSYAAPIIYLYDEQSREVTVKLDVNGKLTHTYPLYDPEEGWTVKTSPDGTLMDEKGRQYEYLFWEADISSTIDLSTGYCVKGEDTATFLEQALADLGLSDTEANTFIMYWLPQMESNPYNVISFQTTTYEEVVRLDVAPKPDTVIRINMAYYGTSEYVEMEPQDLKSMNPSLEEREGLILVEWGGVNIE